MPPPVARLLRLDLFANSRPRFRPREVITAWIPGGPIFAASLRLPSGEWLNLRIHLPPPRPWHSETFLIAFAAMTLAAGLLILWAARRLTRAVRALAEAAERLGRDVNAPPLPEAGPERGRHRGACLQHHGRAHPPLRRRPHPDAGRHRP